MTKKGREQGGVQVLPSEDVPQKLNNGGPADEFRDEGPNHQPTQPAGSIH